jgi:hypothetical protein
MGKGESDGEYPYVFTKRVPKTKKAKNARNDSEPMRGNSGPTTNVVQDFIAAFKKK